MGYEKKVEPISKYEMYAAGISLQLWLVCLNLLPWVIASNDCTELWFNAETSSQQDMIDVHECLSSHRSRILAASSVSLFGFPVVICLIYYIYRLFATIGAFMSLDCSVALAVASWIISTTIYCTVLPALWILIAYYDWEFDTTNNINNLHIGYVMQYQFVNFAILLDDVIIIPLSCPAILPWFWCIAVVIDSNFFQSHHYRLDAGSRQQFIDTWIKCPCCNKFGKWFVIGLSGILIGIIGFSAFADVFDYEKDGFFSYRGKSQYLRVILFLTWQIEAIMFFVFGCRFDQTAKMLTDKVKAVHNPQNSSHLEL